MSRKWAKHLKCWSEDAKCPSLKGKEDIETCWASCKWVFMVVVESSRAWGIYFLELCYLSFFQHLAPGKSRLGQHLGPWQIWDKLREFLKSKWLRIWGFSETHVPIHSKTACMWSRTESALVDKQKLSKLAADAFGSGWSAATPILLEQERGSAVLHRLY